MTDRRSGDLIMHTRLAVLVVDDFRSMTRILDELLRKIGFTDVDAVHDGYTAIDRLRAKNYGLVLSDWEMDPINGAELVRRIRADQAIARIPVILITAKCDQDDSWLVGADGYLTKPFNAEDLSEKIEEVLQRKESDLSTAG